PRGRHLPRVFEDWSVFFMSHRIKELRNCWKARSNAPTMIQQASIDELAFLFRADEPHRPIVLLGAGASFASGIPLAGPMVNEIAKWAYARTVRNTTPDRTHFRRSEREEHLKAQSSFRADVDRAQSYTAAVE